MKYKPENLIVLFIYKFQKEKNNGCFRLVSTKLATKKAIKGKRFGTLDFIRTIDGFTYRMEQDLTEFCALNAQPFLYWYNGKSKKLSYKEILDSQKLIFEEIFNEENPEIDTDVENLF